MGEMATRVGRAVYAAALFVCFGGAFALIPACSGSSSNGDNGDAGAASACDNTKCKANNHCITTASDNKCRFPCQKHLDCPFNYHCDANDGGSEPYCVADNFQYTQGPGQWGTACQANQGFDTNPACDTTDGFWCSGTSPTDGAAFCTVYGCTADEDCGHGFYCGKVNHTPNVKTTARSTGATDTVCLPRDYCSPCKTDIDCGPSNGVTQHCVADSTGQANFCTPECASDTNCQNDAKCGNYGGFSACTPRAGTCVGDGSFCSPCRSDADCPNGLCWSAEYSKEKFCTVKSGKTCTLDSNNKLISDCPTKNPAPGAVVGCTYPAAAQGEPLNQCVGYVLQGTGQDQGYVWGCWSKH